MSATRTCYHGGQDTAVPATRDTVSGSSIKLKTGAGRLRLWGLQQRVGIDSGNLFWPKKGPWPEQRTLFCVS